MYGLRICSCYFRQQNFLLNFCLKSIYNQVDDFAISHIYRRLMSCNSCVFQAKHCSMQFNKQK